MAGHEDTLALEWTAKCALASGTTRAEMWLTLETAGQSGGDSRYAARRVLAGQRGGGAEIRTPEGLPLTRFQVRTQRSRQNWPVRDMRLSGPAARAGHADALVVADVAARWVLEAQAGAPVDMVAEELEVSADFRFAVHNAAGIVSVQEGISVTEALIRLRAFAFSSDRLLADVAQDVISHRLRLG
jgi:hypothetical protein